MNIGIVGCGTMGAGIAQVAATTGHQVIVYDKFPELLEKARIQLEQTLQKLAAKGKLKEDEVNAIVQRMQWTPKLDDLQHAELVIEAIVENLQVKQALFRDLENLVSKDALLASNTSSLSVTAIAACCRYPQRVLGIHFFNPAPLMELVEIVPALQTDTVYINQATDIIRQWKKLPVLARDTPGFIVNRVARPFYSEALRILDEGLADIATIDHAMKQVGGFRMGPFELMDLIGHDVNYTVTESVWTACYYDPKYTPSFTQKRLVEAGWLGRKSSRGFYRYDEGATKPEPVPDEIHLQSIAERIILMLIQEAAQAYYTGIASRDDLDLAMTRGVNYPKGLLQWADEWGISTCVERMDDLYTWYREDRYRCSPLLRQMATQQKTFYP